MKKALSGAGAVVVMLMISVHAHATEATEDDVCARILDGNRFQWLVDRGLFISQFTPGIARSQSDAICVPVAAANGAQTLCFNLTGQVAPPQALVEFVNEAWAVFNQFPDVDRKGGIPFTYHPAMAIGAAHKLGLLDKVVPVGYSNPEWIAQNPRETIPTPSRIRILGIKTKKGAHSLLSLGFDPSTGEILVLDPNDTSQIFRLELAQKDRKLFLRHKAIGENVANLHPGLSARDSEYEVLSIFGLNVKEEMKSANNADFQRR